jgi:hypothetical protein
MSDLLTRAGVATTAERVYLHVLDPRGGDPR